MRGGNWECHSTHHLVIKKVKASIMLFMSNNSEESHVKTFCFTGTLSRYTRAPRLEGLKRPPTEGMALGSPGVEAKSTDEQGYVNLHQTHCTIRVPREQGQPRTCREKFIRTNLRGQKKHMDHLFSLQSRASIWPSCAAGLTQRPSQISHDES